MRYLQFEHEKLGAGNELGLRYLSDYARLEPFYASDYRTSQDLATHTLKLLSRTWRSRFDRDATADLCLAFAQKHGAPKAVLDNIERLRDRQSVCIVTGQQAGLGGGPLLTLYKAMTCVRLARELEQALAQPVVPVFWAASDDSDVEEVNRWRTIAGERLARFRFNIPAGKTPVRDIELPQADDAQWQKLRALIPEGPGREESLQMMVAAAGRDFGSHFVALMLRLLGSEGLVVVEPRALTAHPAWKRVLAAEIENRQEHRNQLQRAADRLEAQGLNAGVPVTHQLNLFRHVAGERRRIADNGAKLLIDGSDSPMTKSALLSALKADPAGFSPSALLRPVVQNAIFPTVAYVGGFAEIAYHALLKGLHRVTQTFMPALFPRISMSLVAGADIGEFAELLAFRATGRPVVVSMGDLAASGGYYISAPADEIWANPATITGSIGIFAAFPTVNRALDKVGISVDGVGTTPLSGEFRVDRPVGPAAAKLLQATINRGYEEFLARVGAGRKKAREEVDAIAQGRVWSGVDAQRLGLVDRLGTFQDAVQAAAKRAGLAEGKYAIDYLEPDLSWAQELALNVKTGAARALAGSWRASPDAPLLEAARRLDPVQRELLRWSRLSSPGRLYAYCFCSAH